MFDVLKQNGIRRIVMAGAIARPQFDKNKMDEYTLNLLPKLEAKLDKGDNELLSFIAENLKKEVIKFWVLQILFLTSPLLLVLFVVLHMIFFKRYFQS